MALDENRKEVLSKHAEFVWSDKQKREILSRTLDDLILSDLYGQGNHASKRKLFYDKFKDYIPEFKCPDAGSKGIPSYVSNIVTSLGSGGGIKLTVAPLLAWLIDTDRDRARTFYKEAGLIEAFGPSALPLDLAVGPNTDESIDPSRESPKKIEPLTFGVGGLVLAAVVAAATSYIIYGGSSGLSEQFSPETPLILDKIEGVWGRNNCNATYRATLTQDALQIVSEKVPEGLEPHPRHFTILPLTARDVEGETGTSIVDATDAQEGEGQGVGATITYRTDGVLEYLTITSKDLSNSSPWEFRRC